MMTLAANTLSFRDKRWSITDPFNFKKEPSGPKPCNPGQYWIQGGCRDCPEGSYDETGVGSMRGNCKPCEAGTYASSAFVQCLSCPAGATVNGAKSGCNCADKDYKFDYASHTCKYTGLVCPSNAVSDGQGGCLCDDEDKSWDSGKNKCLGVTVHLQSSAENVRPAIVLILVSVFALLA